MPSKKKITGHSNLTAPPEMATAMQSPLNLTVAKQKKPKLKNFLLSDLDCERLIALVKEANQASPYKKVSEAAIIKALIFLGGKMDIDKLLKAVREA